KAQNVIRNRDGQPVLTDFGAGCVVDEAPDNPHEVVGTPLCVAPEVLAGGPATTHGDIYSLGVLLYHLAAGTYPVTGGSLKDIREAHASDRRRSLRAARPDLPEALAHIIDRAIAADAEERYPTADALEAALTALYDRRAGTSRTALRERRMRIIAGVAG